MFSWFRKNSAASETWINPALGATLKAESKWPEEKSSTNSTPKRKPSCTLQHTDGQPQAGQPIKKPNTEQPQISWISPANNERGGLAFTNIAGSLVKFEIWDMDASGTLIGKRSLQNLTKQIKGSESFALEEVFCLPDGRAWLTITYWDPRAKTGAWIYNPETQDFKSINLEIESDTWADLPRPWVTTHEFDNATIAVFHSAKKRLAPEVYMNQIDHIWAFSKKHPDGFEVAKLGAKDGNIRTLRLAEKFLWLKTTDPEEQGKPKHFTWSLDISNAL